MAKSVTWALHVLLSARRTLRCLLLHLYMDFSRFFEAACLTLLAWLRVFVMRPVLLTTWLQKWSIRLIIMTILPTGGPLGCWCLCFGRSGAFGFKVEFASEKWVGSGFECVWIQTQNSSKLHFWLQDRGGTGGPGWGWSNLAKMHPKCIQMLQRSRCSHCALASIRPRKFAASRPTRTPLEWR